MSEEKGIIYIMSTAVNGLVKIGQTKTEQYNERMRFLESNGYRNVFALDKDIVLQLLSSFDGKVIFPVNENKEEIFENATENVESKLIPNDTYYFEKQKKSDNRTVKVSAKVDNGKWTILKDSIIGIKEDKGVSQKARMTRENIKFNDQGKLLEDFELGQCTPSFAGAVIMNQSINGWTDWHDKNGNQLDIYRKKDEIEN